MCASWAKLSSVFTCTTMTPLLMSFFYCSPVYWLVSRFFVQSGHLAYRHLKLRCHTDAVNHCWNKVWRSCFWKALPFLRVPLRTLTGLWRAGGQSLHGPSLIILPRCLSVFSPLETPILCSKQHKWKETISAWLNLQWWLIWAWVSVFVLHLFQCLSASHTWTFPQIMCLL